jgi:transcriptional regulator with XRE-family HTH domain
MKMSLICNPETNHGDNVVEREAFSKRLRRALQDADYSSDSPTQLARGFNTHFPGKPITVHAAHKWLIGAAVPTQEKLRALSHWLGVTAEWLRFGESSLQAGVEGVSHDRLHLTPELIKLIQNFSRLDDYHRYIAQNFLELLVHSSANAKSIDKVSEQNRPHSRNKEQNLKEVDSGSELRQR